MKLGSGLCCAFLILFFFSGCSKEPELKEQKTNPRAAKSGKKLIEGEEVLVAPSTSVSLDSGAKLADFPKKDGGPDISKPAQPTIPTQQEMQALIRRAKAGDANAQVDLGNIHFAGLGVPVNKKAAEIFWRSAAKSGHPSAVANLQMLYTKPEEGVSFFGTSSKATRLVFVIDKSGSMKSRIGQESRLDKAKIELKRTLKTLSPEMEFFIFFYDTVELAMPGGKLLKATPKNISEAIKWVDSVECDGGTRPMSALYGAFNLKAEAIWLLTDGAFHESVPNKIRTANTRLKAQINTVGFMDRSGEQALKQIAD
ncbi:MAG: hypothetical protein VYD34_03495, partial [Verrucomicrobiota bacterium]|nr:hypothetical protein [Verrucomicrobiota bacterium]